ncbi:hypothetical protein VYU27_007662 [Nannochloropsis oceanica]
MRGVATSSSLFSPAASEAAAPPPLPRPPPETSHYHILGAGAMGCLVGAALAHKAGVRVSLLTRHRPLFPTATIHVRETYVRAAAPPSFRHTSPPTSTSPSSLSSPPSSPSSSSLSFSTTYAPHVFLEENSSSYSNTTSKISHLLVLTKAYDIKNALKSIAPRLRKDTVVLLLSNGMGYLEEARAALGGGRKGGSSSGSSSIGGKEIKSEDQEDGPMCVVGTITHGGLKAEGAWEGGGEEEVVATRSSSSSSSCSDESVHFYVEHTGLGQIHLGMPLFPSSSSSSSSSSASASSTPSPAPSPPPLLSSLLSHLALAELFPVWESPENMRKMLWKKLGVNVVINPLTALLGCRNGEILDYCARALPPSLPPSLFSSSSSSDGVNLEELVRELCKETAAVAAAVEQEEFGTSFPSSSSPSSLPPSFPPSSSMPTAEELEKFTLQVAKATAGNQSSMHRDLAWEGGREGGRGRRERKTEIEYLNGFIVREGRRLGVPVPRHEVLTASVRRREEEGVREGGGKRGRTRTVVEGEKADKDEQG